MKKNLWIVLAISATAMLTACGASEPAQPDDTADQAAISDNAEVVHVESLAVIAEEARIDSVENPHEDESPVEIEESEIVSMTLPEPWPADFTIPGCFEITSNEPNENGDQVLEAIVPEGTDRPGISDIGEYFKDHIDGWGRPAEDNWECNITATGFEIPLTQGISHINVHGWLDNDNKLTVELIWTLDAE